ncbi:hypothetical protein [Streptomyces sp. NPDC087272]|uniref:hypothetical protein n=1 Tax=Streptomyces sp. NPDC087272 TaxID=3365775 RepID=UPI00380F7956
MRTITLPVRCVLARARLVGVLLVVAGLLRLAVQPGAMPVGTGLMVLLVSMLGSTSVALAVVSPEGGVHRWSCTTHDGDGCDGHCSPGPRRDDADES